MAKNILFIAKDSDKAPGFEDVSIGSTHYREYMEAQGITLFSGVVSCPAAAEEYRSQLQRFYLNGYKVVAILQGSGSLVLPGIMARAGFPVISVPLDIPSYTAFLSPSASRAIAGTGIARMEGNEYQKRQRETALRSAAAMLTMECDSVSISDVSAAGKLNAPEYSTMPKAHEAYRLHHAALEADRRYRQELEAELAKLSIPVSEDSPLLVTVRRQPVVTITGAKHEYGLQLWVNLNIDPQDLNWIRAEQHGTRYSDCKTLQLSSAANAAFYALRILSMGSAERRAQVADIQSKYREQHKAMDIADELDLDTLALGG